MRPEEGGITAGAAAGPDRMIQAARAVAYLEFLLGVLCRPEPALSRGSRSQTRLFLATLRWA